MTPTSEFGDTQKGLVYPRRVESQLEVLRKKTRERKPGTRYPGELCIERMKQLHIDGNIL